MSAQQVVGQCVECSGEGVQVTHLVLCTLPRTEQPAGRDISQRHLGRWISDPDPPIDRGLGVLHAGARSAVSSNTRAGHAHAAYKQTGPTTLVPLPPDQPHHHDLDGPRQRPTSGAHGSR